MKREKSAATLRLEVRQSTLFPHMIRAGERVWQAVAYDESNVSMIVGNDGVILVDTGMLPSVAQEIREEFRKITPLPVRAIIYTHGHGDHTGGSPVFAADLGEIEFWG